MTINERYDAAKSALSAVKDGDDADAIKSAIAEFKAAEDAKKAADEAGALVKALDNTATTKEPTNMEQPRTLGEYAAKNLDLSRFNGGATVARTGFGYKNASQAGAFYPVAVYDNQRTYVNPPEGRSIRDAFGSVTISGNVYSYVQMAGTRFKEDGASSQVEPDGAKPQIVTAYEEQQAYLAKLAAWWYETDELLADNALLASVLDARGRRFVEKAATEFIVDALLNSNGLGNLIGDVTADNIFAAMMQVKSASGFDADAIIMNPADYQTLRLAKDGASGTGQYYGGGYMYGPYGNGDVTPIMGIWGLPVYLTTSVEQNTALVGAFKTAAAVVTKAGEGINVEVHRGDHDDAIHNRVTVVCEERLALAVYDPSAVVKIQRIG